MSSYIPQEIVLNILSRLEVKSLFRFRCVCKSWCNLLTSHDFVKMHLDHAVDEKNNYSLIMDNCGDLYSIDFVSASDYEAVKIDRPFKFGLAVDILGSCNGLLCDATDFGDTFFIWNPSTKEYKEISRSPIVSRSNCIAYGFGYDYKIYDYKLVTIVSSFRSVNFDFEFEVHVYTLGSSSWRNVRSVPQNRFVPIRQAGVLLNGALHWIKVHPTDESQIIISFDIGDERFQEIELPNCLVGIYSSDVGVVRGNLCLIGCRRDSYDLWVMKEYGVIESWTKLFSIARETNISFLKPIYSLKNDEILFEVLLNNQNGYSHGLVSYDPNRGIGRLLKIRGTPIVFDSIETHVGSLVSPNLVLS